MKVNANDVLFITDVVDPFSTDYFIVNISYVIFKAVFTIHNCGTYNVISWFLNNICKMFLNKFYRISDSFLPTHKRLILCERELISFPRRDSKDAFRLGSIRNTNNWNNTSKRLFGSYSHSGIPGFPFLLFCSQEQNSWNKFQNKFRNIFLFRNIPNERALTYRMLGIIICFVL